MNPSLTPTQARRAALLTQRLTGQTVTSTKPYGRPPYARPLTGKITGLGLYPYPTLCPEHTGIRLVVKTDHGTWFPNLREVTLTP